MVKGALDGSFKIDTNFLESVFEVASRAEGAGFMSLLIVLKKDLGLL